jgi:signal transduction histidine kinase
LASVGRLSAGIAHEIGNPIGIVLGYLDLLNDNDLQETEKNEFILRSKCEIEKIGAIVRNLLDFSRTSTPTIEVVSVHKIIADVINVMKLHHSMANITLKLGLTNQGRDSVLANFDQLRQVFFNVILNAADAIVSANAEGKGEIFIETEVLDRNGYPADQGNRLRISFIDNGSGIPEESLPNIFDPFFTTKEPGKGTGLGLSVSFMIVQEFKGTMEAARNEGGGTTMTLFLPIYDGPPVSQIQIARLASEETEWP